VLTARKAPYKKAGRGYCADREGPSQHRRADYPICDSCTADGRTESTMRLLVLVLAGVLVSAKAVDFKAQPRLLSSAIRIIHLHHEIKDLDQEIEKAKKIDPFGFVMEMHSRLDQVEGKVIYSPTLKVGLLQVVRLLGRAFSI